MSHEQDYGIDRGGGAWDGIWRGRSSSVRRGLTNSAGTAASMASVLREAARLVEGLPASDRSLEIHGLCDEIVEMTQGMLAIVDELRAHAGLPAPATRKRGAFSRVWRFARRDFMRWLLG